MLQSWTVPHLSYKNQSRELGQSQSPRNFTSKATLYRDALKNLAESLHIPGNLKQSQTHSENRSSQRKDQTYSKNGLFQDERLKKVLEGKPESQINFPKGSAQHGTSKTVLEGNHGPQTKFPNKSVQDGASTKSESKSRQLAGTTPKPAEAPDSATRRDGLVGPQPKTAFVTYNDTVVIQCLDSSPYILCSGRPAPRSRTEQAADAARHPPWKFSLARELGWTPPVDFSVCPYSNCVDVGHLPQEDTDVVGINGVGLRDDYRLPHRGAGSTQSFMFMAWESPIHTRASFLSDDNSAWNRAMNMTCSYRVDSDVFVPYGFLSFEPKPLSVRPNYYEIAQKKTKWVAWFVSNCNTPSKRMQYVKQMKAYIDVDIFGACGTPCPRFQPKCENALLENYKFYLSFENSLCTDYVTEKFFKVFKDNTFIIPVTRGGADYAKYFPANIFINAADFMSPRELAEHLKSLGSDTKRYSQMIEQNDMYRVYGGHSTMWCSLCERLNTKGPPQQVVNLKTWWSDGHCHSPFDFR
ncbi:hypothetical protein RRG08_029047 [Elysia crispata]|uniref:Fucosyltransferase n=1 Tax=Elysia crispata TaxID=231223 RepID=A0AAE1DHP1_9GAST|nr:hypothetical protein RRG08_029047 [Elysia crispata]